MDALLPVIKDTIVDAASKKTKSKRPELEKEVQRRKKVIERMKKAAEQGAIFKVGSSLFYSLS